tara:strand:+ start:5212 stop:5742 length:531 start_codon:yes stop_codon:yes gene_type:complete
MDFQLYTPREIKSLTTNSDTGYIDNIKVRVAKRTKNVEEWSYRYLTATRILKALVQMAEIKSPEDERVWFVPKSPSRLFIRGEKEVEVTNVEYKGKREQSVMSLEPVFDRPRRELLDYLTILGAGSDSPEGDLSYLRYDVGFDMNERFIRITWSIKSHPEQRNVTYLHRGSKEKKK